MTNTQTLIMCAFNGQVDAEVAKNAIDELSDTIAELDVRRTAIVRKNDKGEVIFHEPGNWRETATDLAGAVAKGLAWIVYNAAGMLGPLAGVTAEADTKATIERFTKDTGFPDAALREVGTRLDAGHSALIAIIDADDREDVIKLLTDMGGHVLDNDLPADLVSRLSE